MIGDADLLLVILIDENATVEQVYYGSYSAAEDEGTFNERQNRIIITLAKLRKLAESEPQLT